MEIKKVNNNEWKCWNKEMKVVYISKKNDTGLLGHGKFYRVVGSTGTVGTLIDHFQTAKKIAKDYLRGE